MLVGVYARLNGFSGIVHLVFAPARCEKLDTYSYSIQSIFMFAVSSFAAVTDWFVRGDIHEGALSSVSNPISNMMQRREHYSFWGFSGPGQSIA
jgi:hypothetical protein